MSWYSNTYLPDLWTRDPATMPAAMRCEEVHEPLPEPVCVGCDATQNLVRHGVWLCPQCVAAWEGIIEEHGLRTSREPSN